MFGSLFPPLETSCRCIRSRNSTVGRAVPDNRATCGFRQSHVGCWTPPLWRIWPGIWQPVLSSERELSLIAAKFLRKTGDIKPSASRRAEFGRVHREIVANCRNGCLRWTIFPASIPRLRQQQWSQNSGRALVLPQTLTTKASGLSPASMDAPCVRCTDLPLTTPQDGVKAPITLRTTSCPSLQS